VRKGATTIWERWDAIQEDGSIYNPQMNSYNHYAYGAVCQWLLEGVAGFRPDPQQPGFETIIFEPTIISDLSPVAATHDSPKGLIKAGWTVEGDKVRYEIEVPNGAKGVLKLSDDYSDVIVDGAPLTGGNGELASGQHVVTFTYSEHGRLQKHATNENTRTP
jgi:alpha-L-rhamnosidase